MKPASLKAMAGVANIGDDVNWCGHHFAQSNWYAFGRLAWNPNLSSEQIADEWLRQTFSNDERLIAPMEQVMLDSREACVNYMMPLGIHHIFAGGHHYGPEPWYALKVCAQTGHRLTTTRPIVSDSVSTAPRMAVLT